MKSARACLLSLSLLIAAGLAAENLLGKTPEPALAPSPAWFACERDADCADINYPCAGATVNQRFMKEANEYYGRENATRECAMPPESASKSPPFRVFCKNKKCGKQGINPKMGFS